MIVDIGYVSHLRHLRVWLRSSKEVVRRLGAGAPRPAFDDGCAGPVRRLDARALSGRQDLRILCLLTPMLIMA